MDRSPFWVSTFVCSSLCSLIAACLCSLIAACLCSLIVACLYSLIAACLCSLIVACRCSLIAACPCGSFSLLARRLSGAVRDLHTANENQDILNALEMNQVTSFHPRKQVSISCVTQTCLLSTIPVLAAQRVVKLRLPRLTTSLHQTTKDLRSLVEGPEPDQMVNFKWLELQLFNRKAFRYHADSRLAVQSVSISINVL